MPLRDKAGCLLGHSVADQCPTGVTKCVQWQEPFLRLRGVAHLLVSVLVTSGVVLGPQKVLGLCWSMMTHTYGRIGGMAHISFGLTPQCHCHSQSRHDQ